MLCLPETKTIDKHARIGGLVKCPVTQNIGVRVLGTPVNYCIGQVTIYCSGSIINTIIGKLFTK